jgi:hypothetical protein
MATIQGSSSRLDRSHPIAGDGARLEAAVSAHAIRCCERAFDGSAFFQALAAGAVDEGLMRYAFLQYRFFRDQLHRWFGLCIVKGPSCRDPAQKAAIMALADHVFTDLRDAHEEMYDAFLRDLGVSEADASLAAPSPATCRYIQSFFDDFGLDTSGFFVALTALGGRELCVSLRNRRLIDQYFGPRGLAPPTWIALHAELELEHFHDAIRPVLGEPHGGDATTFAAASAAVEQAVSSHVRLFDDLLGEHHGR